MQGDQIKIGKKYVHKIKEENVFLCNLRRILPLTIDKNFYENNIRDAVNQDEYEYLSKFYCPYTANNGISKESSPAEKYALRYLPVLHFLVPEQYESLLAEKSTIWEKELIASFYIHENQEGKEYYRLKEDISEPHDSYLVFSEKAWDMHINIEERSKIASLLEQIPEMPKKEIYFANMYVNIEHSFFFEHPNDHVPGMMLIETIRQFIVACGHVFGKSPIDGTQLILNSLDCQFMSYININYPILLKGTAVDYKFTREGYWQQIKLQVEVMQNGRLMALFNLNGTGISSNLFARIRRNQIAEMKQSRFIPQFDGKYTLELLPNGEKKPIMADLINLSVEGISLKITADNFMPDHNFYEITLLRTDQEKITGRYKKIWHSENDGYIVIGLRNTELAEQDLKRLYKLITQDFIALEQRELN